MVSLTGFIETKVELVKLDVENEVKKIIAKGVIIVFIGMTASLVVFLISVGLANFLNDLLDSQYLGFWIMALVYLLICVIAYTRRETIYTSVLEGLNAKKENEHEQE